MGKNNPHPQFINLWCESRGIYRQTYRLQLILWPEGDNTCEWYVYTPESVTGHLLERRTKVESSELLGFWRKLTKSLVQRGHQGEVSGVLGELSGVDQALSVEKMGLVDFLW